MQTPIATLASDRVRVEFHWLGDRFGHTISLVDNEHAQLVWESMQADECGPAFQELHEQTAADGEPILFLSGASGGAHWSMSVHRDAGAIHFDLAARVATPPVDRAVQYQAQFATDCHVPLQPLDATMQLGFATPLATLKPISSGEDTLPATRRWTYAATSQATQ